MTLVAGFKCHDGFVVAADTEITIGDLRFQGHKLVSYQGRMTSCDLIMGGAGDAVYIDSVCQNIRDAVALLSEPSVAAIKGETAKAIAQIHSYSIFKHWQPDDPRRPHAQLVCGVQTQKREWGLFQTDRDVVSEVGDHAVAGSGAVLAEYLIERLWLPSLSTAVTVHLAAQLFREIKGKGIYVGGNTEIIGVRVRPDAEPFFEMSGDYRFLWGLDELLASAVRNAISIKNPPHLLTERLADISSRLDKLRKDTEEPRITPSSDMVRLTEFGSEYGDSFKDL